MDPLSPVIRIAAPSSDGYVVKNNSTQDADPPLNQPADLKSRLRKVKYKAKTFNVNNIIRSKQRSKAQKDLDGNVQKRVITPSNLNDTTLIVDHSYDTANDSAILVATNPRRMMYPNAEVQTAEFTMDQYKYQFEVVTEKLKEVIDNDPQLKQRGKSILYKLCMVGTTPQTAVPSIVIGCKEEDEKAIKGTFKRHETDNFYCHRGSDWFKKFLKKDTPTNMPPLFQLYYCKTTCDPYRRLASEITFTTSLSSVPTFCGSLVRFEGRMATITLTLEIDGIDRILTIDHLKGLQNPDNTCESSSFKTRDVDETTLNEDDYIQMGPLWKNADDEEEVEAAVLPSIPPHLLQSDRQSLVSGYNSPSALTGEMRPVEPPVPLDPAEPYLDWISLECDTYSMGLRRCNLIDVPGQNKPILLKEVATKPRIHGTPVYIISGVRKILTGQLLNTTTYIGSNPGQRLCEVWTVILDNQLVVIPGESGSIVVDQKTSHVYGYVVASDMLGHALIVPLFQTIRQIQASFNARIVRLPQTAKSISVPEAQVPSSIDPRQPVLTLENPMMGSAAIQSTISTVAQRDRAQDTLDRQIGISAQTLAPKLKGHFQKYSGARYALAVTTRSTEDTDKLSNSTHGDISENFRYFVKEHSSIGCHDNQALFITRSKLVEYWTLERIRESLDLHDPVSDEIVTKEITSRYLKIFSILVYISKGNHYAYRIMSFMQAQISDAQLPLTTCPEHLARSGSSSGSIFEDFYHHQWIFCPVFFEQGGFDSELPSEAILPFIEEEQLSRGHSRATFRRVRLHPECHALELSNFDSKHHFIVKTFGDRDKDVYAREVEAYTMLQRSSSPRTPIVKANASYTWRGSHNIILEYADRGSLDEFWASNAPPVSHDSIRDILESLLKLSQALQELHKTPSGVHGDIKPENILVFRPSNNSSALFKLKDFGLTNYPTKIKKQVDKGTLITSSQLKLNGIGECGKTAKSRVDDIWSLGCVFLEFITWMCFGKEHRTGLNTKRAYRRLNAPKEAIQTDDWGLWPSDSCVTLRRPPQFLLKCLKAARGDQHVEREFLTVTMEDKLRYRACERADVFTPAMLPIIRQMLAAPKERPSAIQVYEWSMAALSRVAAGEPQQSATVGRVLEWIDGRKKTSPLRRTGYRAPERVLISSAPWEHPLGPIRPSGPLSDGVPSRLRSNLRGRDHVFVIDDSISMLSEHWDDCLKTFRALAYLVKDMDPDGLDVRLSSNPNQRDRYRHTTPAVKALEKVRSPGRVRKPGAGDPEPLGVLPVLEGIMRPRLVAGSRQKPIIVFVLTNGTWDQSSPERKSLEGMTGLVSGDLPEGHTSIHVIQFGANTNEDQDEHADSSSDWQTRRHDQQGSQTNGFIISVVPAEGSILRMIAAGCK